MTLKYLNLTGLNALVSAIKTWVLSRIPTKTSELTNDANFITSNDLPTNHVTTDTTQSITSQKTWTGEQSFTLPIVGSITGTASKAIADEDGTSIKTGYVNVAGNQTVSGQKTWSGNQFYTAGAYHRNNSYEIGNTPASNVAIPIYFTDKVNAHTGYVRNVILTTGKTQSELLARNKFTSGALSPTGTDVSSTLQVEVQSNGDKTLYFDGSIRNNVLPYATNTYALGSSTYQWSSVYAQTYYYNGTAWGLDKANTWTGDNTYTKYLNALINGCEIGVVPTYTNKHGILFKDTNGVNIGWLRHQYDSNGDISIEMSVSNKYKNGVLDPTGTQIYQGVKQVITASGESYFAWSGKINNSIEPRTNNTYNLGSSTNKWKSLNGINPGALSLPNYSDNTYIDISGSIVPPSGQTTINYSGGENQYIPPVDGWLSIRCDGATFLQIYRNAYNCPGTTASRQDASGKLVVTLPVLKNTTYTIKINTSGTTNVFQLYPCLGNV